MRSVLYPAGREGILDESIRMRTDDVRVALVKTTYNFDPAHRFMSDLAGTTNGRTDSLAGRRFDLGVFDAHDTELTAAGVAKCDALVIYQHTWNDATARLIAYVVEAEGLPFIAQAEQRVPIVWDDGPDRIFQL